MIKAIFFDIDGTLVTRQANVLESTKQAIAKAKANGIICGIATGRAPIRLNQQIDALDLDIFITYNGQFVYTKDRTIYADHFSKETLDQIVTFCDTNDRQIIFGSQYEMAGSAFMQMGQKKWITKLANIFPSFFPVKTLKNTLSLLSPRRRKHKYRELSILDSPIFQCVLLSPEAEFDYLKNQLVDCHFTRSNPYTVDIIPAGGSKLNGIEQFTKAYNLSLEEVMVFGDSWNDLEMLEGVGVGVAMGNSSADVKQVADFVTKTNEADGICYALKQYKII